MTTFDDAADAGMYQELTDPRPLSEWHEDMGPVLWWKFPIEEPPYVGSPLDLGMTVKVTTLVKTARGQMPANNRQFDIGGWPGYHTHFTPIPMPKVPK